MKVRERLFELLNENFCEYARVDIIQGKCKVRAITFDVEKFADFLISNGVTAQKWIPVSERLPEVGDRCLCNVKSFAFPGSFYQAILKYDKYGFVEDCIYTDDVTHWMPLPEPPEKE